MCSHVWPAGGMCPVGAYRSTSVYASICVCLGSDLMSSPNHQRRCCLRWPSLLQTSLFWQHEPRRDRGRYERRTRIRTLLSRFAIRSLAVDIIVQVRCSFLVVGYAYAFGNLQLDERRDPRGEKKQPLPFHFLASSCPNSFLAPAIATSNSVRHAKNVVYIRSRLSFFVAPSRAALPSTSKHYKHNNVDACVHIQLHTQSPL